MVLLIPDDKTKSELLSEVETLVIRCVHTVLDHRFKDNNLLANQSTRQEDTERYLSKKDAAKIAGVGTSTIDNWIRGGFITKFKFGGAVRIKQSNLLAYLETKAA